MTLRSRAVDARLGSIERALIHTGLRLNAAIRREDAGDATAVAVVAAMHARIDELIRQATALRPVSPNGLASKARVAVWYRERSHAGRAALYSLVEDLHALEHDHRRQTRAVHCAWPRS